MSLARIWEKVIKVKPDHQLVVEYDGWRVIDYQAPEDVKEVKVIVTVVETRKTDLCPECGADLSRTEICFIKKKGNT